MPNKYLDSVGLAEYTGLVKDYVDTKADDYLPLAGGTLTGNVYTTPYYDSTIVDPEGGQTLVVCKGKVAKGTAPSNNEYHTMAMAVDNSGSTNNAYKYGQVETDVKTDGSVETIVQAYKNEANSTTSAKISVGYDANGNVFTSAPTPTAGDNSTKIATTAFVNTKAGNYLPLAGGTMTGTITAGTTDVLKSSANNSRVVLMGGTGYSSSASVILNGGDASVNAGTFQLLAQGNSSARTFLIGYPDGTLTWAGKNIERVNASGTNYIRYESGLQICWGDLSVGGAAVTDGTVTFPQAFKNGSSYAVSTSRSWAYQPEDYYIKSKSGTGFTWSTSGTVSSNNHGYPYIAIGYWK